MWTEKNKPKLRDIKPTTRPKTLIEELSEALLGTFRDVRLIDPYDVYQHLMTYWADTMQDDVYAIVADGWVPAAQPRRIVEVKGKKTTEKPDLVVNRLKFKTELIPLPLLVARYFATEQEAIDAHTAEEEKAAQQMEELREEHGGEDGLLAEVTDDKGKITKGAVTDRLKKIKTDKDAADERAMLAKYQTIMDREIEHRAKAREATEALHELALEKFGALTEDEVKALVVEDKWLAALAADVRGELDRVSRALTSRVSELAARYAAPLPTLAAEADNLAKRVSKHLAKMGAA